jgi:hypothetical protein
MHSAETDEALSLGNSITKTTSNWLLCSICKKCK